MSEYRGHDGSNFQNKARAPTGSGNLDVRVNIQGAGGRYEVYCFHEGLFCPCCSIALRISPTTKRDKERLRQIQLRREEQERIIRIINGTKK